jgi:hypothetical protein
MIALAQALPDHHAGRVSPRSVFIVRRQRPGSGAWDEYLLTRTPLPFWTKFPHRAQPFTDPAAAATLADKIRHELDCLSWEIDVCELLPCGLVVE